MTSQTAPFTWPDPTIQIAPQDWYRATWRNLPPLLPPEPRPFSWERVERRYFVDGYLVWERIDYMNAAIAEHLLSEEEAHFWMRVLVTMVKERAGDRVPELSLAAAQQPVLYSEAQKKLTKLTAFTLSDGVINILLSAYAPRQVVALLCLTGSSYFGDMLHQRLLPYISPAERRHLQMVVRNHLADQKVLDALDVRLNHYQVPVSIWLLGVLGMTDEMMEVISKWGYSARPNSWFSGQPQQWLMGLDDPRQLQAHVKEWRFFLEEDRHVRGWLAHLETADMGFISESFSHQRANDERRKPVEALLLVHRPETVTQLVKIFNDKPPATLMSARPLLRPWLLERPELGLAGLAPLVNQTGVIGGMARDHVQWLVNRDSRLLAVFEQLVEAQSWRPEQVMAVPYTAESMADWWLAAVAERPLKGMRLPEWLSADDLPPLLFKDGHRLNSDQTQQLLMSMGQSRLKDPHPLIGAVFTAAKPDSLVTFTVKLMSSWGRYHDKWRNCRWVLNTLLWWHTEPLPGALYELLASLVQRRDQYRYVVLDLEWFSYILSLWEQVATDAVLKVLARFQRSKDLWISYEMLQKTIDNCMQRRGLNRSQLHDLMIPTFGLNERSERLFDLGDEVAAVGVDEDLRPMVRWRGRQYRSLPEQFTTSESLRNRRVAAAWNRLETELPQVLDNELWRLDRALVYERRWKWSAFEQQFLNHPIMRHVGRSIIWGRYMFNGQLTHSFVLTEDGTPLSVEYDEVDLPNYGYYGLIHPIDLTLPERLTWHEMLTDYEIVTIFDQLFRPVYMLSAEERASSVLTRFNKRFEHEMGFTLRNLHWKPLNGLGTWRRFFPYSNVSALLTLHTVTLPDGSTADYFEGCRFAVGKVELQGLPYVDHIAKLPLQWLLPRRVRPRIVSEALWNWAQAVGETEE